VIEFAIARSHDANIHDGDGWLTVAWKDARAT